MFFSPYDGQDSCVPCDLCEGFADQKRGVETEAPLFLCRECMEYFDAIPDYFEELLEGYLTGNVI